MDDTTDPDLRCHVWWDDEHGVAHNDWLPGSICDLPAARQVTAAVSAFGRGPVPVLVDMRFLAKADRAAREHFTGPEAQATAVALLVASAVSKVVANFVISVQKLPVPVRMFTDQEAATTWLGEHSG